MNFYNNFDDDDDWAVLIYIWFIVLIILSFIAR